MLCYRELIEVLLTRLDNRKIKLGAVHLGLRLVLHAILADEVLTRCL